MRAARIALIGVGVAVMVTGGVFALIDIAPTQYLGVLSWVVGALVIHDGILAPIIVAVGLGLRSARARWGLRRVLVAQASLTLGAFLTVIASPGILKSMIGSTNPTMLQLPYAAGLAVSWLVLLVVVVVALSKRARTK